MLKNQTFWEMFTSPLAEIPISEFLVNLWLSALLAFLLGRFYRRFGSSLSNREMFARNFPLISMTTMVVITIVKSSLQLSLGLVGALSIIRFRAAIKEPEELAYLFLTISLGLGLGAEQTVITVVAFMAILAVLALKHMVRPTEQQPNFYLAVTVNNSGPVAMSSLVSTLKQHCTSVHLKRFDETPEVIEAGFLVSFAEAARLDACNASLHQLLPGLKLSYHDEGGLSA